MFLCVRDPRGAIFLSKALTLRLANWHSFGIMAHQTKRRGERLFMTVASADRYPFDPTAVSSDRPLPLYLQLADHLRQLITQGALTDGDVLPGEREIAERLGVSRV